MKRSFISLACILYLSSPLAWADATGAGDAAILQELIVLVKTANDQLKQVQEMTDITEKIREMESLKHVRTISETGSQFNQLFSELGTSYETVQDLINDPGGLNELEREIEYMRYKAEMANSNEGMAQARAYARLASDLKRIRFLQQSNKAAQRQLGSGASTEEAHTINASNSTIMADIMLNREKEAKKAQIMDTDAAATVMEQSNYSSLYGEAK